MGFVTEEEAFLVVVEEGFGWWFKELISKVKE